MTNLFLKNLPHLIMSTLMRSKRKFEIICPEWTQTSGDCVVGCFLPLTFLLFNAILKPYSWVHFSAIFCTHDVCLLYVLQLYMLCILPHELMWVSWKVAWICLSCYIISYVECKHIRYFILLYSFLLKMFNCLD